MSIETEDQARERRAAWVKEHSDVYPGQVVLPFTRDAIRYGEAVGRRQGLEEAMGALLEDYEPPGEMKGMEFPDQEYWRGVDQAEISAVDTIRELLAKLEEGT